MSQRRGEPPNSTSRLWRHYWVLISLALTILATVVLLLHMPTVSSIVSIVLELEHNVFATVISNA